MSRRGENIYKRKDKRWEGRYIKGRKANGKIQYGYVYHRNFKKMKEKLLAKKWEYQQIQEVHGTYAGTVHDWLSFCLDKKKPQIKESTHTTYLYKVEKYVFPYLGELSLREVAQKDVQEWVDALVERPLSGTMIHTVFQLAHRFFVQAVKEGHLGSDPFQEVVLPAKEVKKVEPLTNTQQKKLEQTAAQDKHGKTVLFALQTGLRIGELAALRWENIDFSTGLITIDSTYQRILSEDSGTKLQLSKPKTKASERIIPMSNALKTWLLSWQPADACGFVFQVKDHPMEPRLISYHFKRICTEAGVENCHFHQLRHTFATRLLEKQGTIADISALLGHSSTQMTLDVYTGSDLTERRKVVNRLDIKWVG
ncbi:tyrosine-type recombinase/integrase [Enterococcus sp. 669A]|uniref:Tyrosine-type recombinase/integrase n=1 Tax=Candidatus Enterococcus moelleringii TaxID=2815325 RepID=A0ABS3LAQ5_9ENTE|nr:site-specific integrase [Enterococcus sp. 669A]MBO1306123.1 tyrosine-type recombinase/integrase [Enterococcus sp. 669A]